ncbi:unnamed protein product [Ilex paraguariensis]|uniref:Uncharacterized protein n=1 Tax=Ilex paraguariensis TaxID=185542 RepID=A0ABC8ULZ2_9AQUA
MFTKSGHFKFLANFVGLPLKFFFVGCFLAFLFADYCKGRKYKGHVMLMVSIYKLLRKDEIVICTPVFVSYNEKKREICSLHSLAT